MYRLLEIGEEMREGDESYNNLKENWTEVYSNWAGELNEGHYMIRRKITSYTDE